MFKDDDSVMLRSEVGLRGADGTAKLKDVDDFSFPAADTVSQVTACHPNLLHYSISIPSGRSWQKRKLPRYGGTRCRRRQTTQSSRQPYPCLFRGLL